VITFHLRKGVAWHDGAPFTAADVEFTYKVMIDPKTPTAYGEDFRQVKKFEVVDPATVRVTYGKPFAPALASWGFSVMPKHLLAGKDLASSPLARPRSGPAVPLQGVEARREDRPGGERGLLGRPSEHRPRHLPIIPDNATMFLELRAGSVDMMGLEPLQYTRQTDTDAFRAKYNKYRYLASGYSYLGFNLNLPLFQDKRVRQALSHAINKQEIIDIVLLGLGREATGPTSREPGPTTPT